MLALKSQTANHHQETEALFFPDGTNLNAFTIPHYHNFMISNYIFNFLLEEALANGLPDDVKHTLEFDQRKKSHFALYDLKELGYSEDEIVGLKANFKLSFSGLSSLLGAAYVAEGSTLGGNVIKRTLSKNPLYKTYTFQYLGCYGEALRERWIAFGEVCKSLVKDENEIQNAVKAAQQSFALMADISRFVSSNFNLKVSESQHS